MSQMVSVHHFIGRKERELQMNNKSKIEENEAKIEEIILDLRWRFKRKSLHSLILAHLAGVKWEHEIRFLQEEGVCPVFPTRKCRRGYYHIINEDMACFLWTRWEIQRIIDEEFE